jgi:signal transduction histidine kinase
LFIVKELVTLQGGEIWFESSVDAGTTFSVTIPVA